MISNESGNTVIEIGTTLKRVRDAEELRLAEFRRDYAGRCGLNEIQVGTLEHMEFFSAPASTKYHGNYPGGLYDHSKAVTNNLVMLTVRLGLEWELERSPYIVGMLHDLCKCGMYRLDKQSGKYEYNNGLVLPGHGERSVMMAQQMEIELTTEEILCIRWHMGAFDEKAMWDYYGRAIEVCNNVLWTHTADMMAARIDGV